MLAGIDPKHRVEHLDPSDCGLTPLHELRHAEEARRARAWNHGPVFGIGAVFGGCAHNIMHACALRHLARQEPAPAAGAFNWFLGAVTAPGGLVDLYHHQLEPNRFAGPWEWLNRWPRSKADAILHSVSRWHRYAPSVVRLFIKTEVGPVQWDDVGDPEAHPVKPRMIQAYANLATQFTQSYEVASIQARLFHLRRVAIGPMIDCTVACGMTPAAVASWASEVETAHPLGAWLELDASSFDATIQSAHYEVKMAVYRALGMSEATMKFLAAGFRVRGVSITSQGGRVETRAEGTVKSGHADTTLGNSIINAAVICTALNACGCRASVIVAGDDALVRFCHPSYDFRVVGAAICTSVSALGLRPKGALHHRIERASFISLCFFRSECGQLVASPKPGRQLAKLFWSIRNVPPTQREGYVRCVCDGMLAICPSIPVLSPWLRAVSAAHQCGKDFRGKVGIYLLDSPDSAGQTPARDVRRSFCERYGFTDDEVVELERHVVTTCQPGIYYHPLVERMKRLDLGDFCGEEPLAMVGRERR